MGRTQEAISDYTLAIEIDPAKAETRRRRGEAYNNEKSYGLAIADFTTAIRLDPNECCAYLYRGVAYGSLGEHETAMRDFTTAIEISHKPANTPERQLTYRRTEIDAINDRGYSYARLGRYDEAIQDYNHAIEMDPNHVIAYINRANAFMSKRVYGAAIEDLSKVLVLDPTRRRCMLCVLRHITGWDGTPRPWRTWSSFKNAAAKWTRRPLRP